MRLLNTESLEFKEFYEADIPGYAILSHRWQEDEVSYKEYAKALRSHRNGDKPKLGMKKVISFCSFAAADGFGWGWIDTCCIDKRSSAELSEAINSMFQWYADAQICYVYLLDVRTPDRDRSNWDEVMDDLDVSAWFTRGWTLQEFLAPEYVDFVSKDWKHIGWKGLLPPIDRIKWSVYFPKRFKDPDFTQSLTDVVSKISGIPTSALSGQGSSGQIREFCIAEKMWWMAQRTTSRSEDMAYSLMGLFGVNMPLLYGEGGERAFVRLQLEIIKKSTDSSIFAWAQPFPAVSISSRDAWRVVPQWKGLLAPSPTYFLQIGSLFTNNDGCDYTVSPIQVRRIEDAGEAYDSTFTMTPRGLQVDFIGHPLSEELFPGVHIVWLDCDTSRGRCIVFLQSTGRGMALKGDGDYTNMVRLLSDIDPSSVAYSPTKRRVRVRLCIEQSGFNDPDRASNRLLLERPGTA